MSKFKPRITEHREEAIKKIEKKEKREKEDSILWRGMMCYGICPECGYDLNKSENSSWMGARLKTEIQCRNCGFSYNDSVDLGPK